VFHTLLKDVDGDTESPLTTRLFQQLKNNIILANLSVGRNGSYVKTGGEGSVTGVVLGLCTLQRSLFLFPPFLPHNYLFPIYDLNN
jgi:hypothetical protein